MEILISSIDVPGARIYNYSTGNTKKLNIPRFGALPVQYQASVNYQQGDLVRDGNTTSVLSVFKFKRAE